MRRPRRRCLSRGALRRRYGCFRLPPVKGASSVSKAKRRDVSWLARTDPDSGTVEFSEHFGKLSPEGQRYIVLHEQAHLEAGADHNDKFYTVLKRLVKQHRVSWQVAYELEQFNCHARH
jgi:predicted metal-dependent hydrolase